MNDAPPPPGGEDRLFWFTLLVAPRDESRAWEGLHELVLAHRDTLAPDGGWAGPILDGEPIGYRYVIRFREFNPPLVYPRAETFLVVGVMSVLRSGDPAGNRRVLGIERDFVDMARARGLRLYLQAENIGGRVDLRAYYGERTYRHFRELRRRLDPQRRFNRGVVFPDDEV